MRQFVYGNARQFASLYEQLSGETRKKIWFTVAFPNGEHARLGFYYTGEQIVLEMAQFGNEEFPSYNGDNELFHKLATERHAEFESEEQMRSAFYAARNIYERVSRHEQTEEAQNEDKRIVHVPTVVDSVKLADKIKTRIIGQDAQVEGICKCVCNH